MSDDDVVLLVIAIAALLFLWGSLYSFRRHPPAKLRGFLLLIPVAVLAAVAWFFATFTIRLM